MAFARPVSVGSTDGTWTNGKGGRADLHTAVDETSHSEADYVRTALPVSLFSNAGTLSGEDSRASYTTAGSTACQNIIAHALGVNDNAHKLRIIIPDATDLAALTPIVLALHGFGGSEDIITTGGMGDNGMTDAWLDAGWPVLAATGAGDSWGNNNARDGYLDVWEWVTSIFACPGFLIYGQSMGGCAGLNFLLDCTLEDVPVLAFAGNSAVTNFANVYQNDATLKASMQTAYGLGSVGISDPTYIAAVNTDRGGHDPQLKDASAFPSIPFRFYASSGDTTVSKTQNTDAFVTKLTSASWPHEVNTVAFSGGHVAAASYQPTDCVDFYLRAIA